MSLQNYIEPKRIKGVHIIQPNLHEDCGGEFMEIARLVEGKFDLYEEPLDIKQFNYSLLHPGTIKAFHVHRNQVDCFFPLQKMIINLIDLRPIVEGMRDFQIEQINFNLLKGRIKTLPHMRLVLNKQMVIIPPGVAHGISNPYLDDRILLYLVTQNFNPKDEHRIAYNIIGESIWKTVYE